MNLEILVERYENQIELAFDTLVQIQELEVKEWPARHLSNRHEIAVSMMFMWILTRSIWDKLQNLPIDKSLIIIKECWEATHEHLKELYWFDTHKSIN